MGTCDLTEKQKEEMFPTHNWQVDWAEGNVVPEPPAHAK